MRLSTPKGLAYPIAVTKLLRQPGDDIEQNTPLFTYKYEAINNEWDAEREENVDRERTYYADFESEVEGNVTTLSVKAGQVINGVVEVADIEEPCKHEVQFGGMCANCGKDMNATSYNTTKPDSERAKINTFHGHTELLVSAEVASKADEEAKRRLLSARKLSLVVDLDQTIIHATVDPTVREWQDDESNPNHEAVKHVAKFQLMDDGPGARGCWYYIKLRPGLHDFLQTISQHYELHIYTMGTRAYAHNIAKIVDPDHKIFGDRILSRDENGNVTAKTLRRLFPVDTKMVVIIDDRGDVWSWSPNLVKVSPYDFFVGIGDINSSFLPKRPGLETVQSKPTLPDKARKQAGPKHDAENGDTANADGESDSNATPASPSTQSQANGEASAVDRMVSMAGNQDADSIKEKSHEQDETIAAQMADRPLLQKQKILDAAEEAQTSPAVEAAVELLAEGGEKEESATESLPHPKYRHNLLQDDDTELDHLEQSLCRIHQTYFDEYDRENAGSKGGRLADLRPGHSKKRSIDELELIPDAALVMASLKLRVLQGVNLVFSGVVPLGVDIQSHDLVIWAKTFGATVSDNISKRTTHVIASPERRTAKVRQAAKKGDRIAIVSQNWLFACFSRWRKVDEDPYRIHSDAPANGTAGLPDSFESKTYELLSSSDEEAQTDDDTENGIKTPNGVAGGGLQIDMEELEKYKPSMDQEEGSPTETEKDWSDLNAELDEFMEGEEYDSDTESVASEASTSSEAVSKSPPGQRKRKREAAGDGGGASEDDLMDEAEGSRLQKRKKEALSRTSSLTNVAVAPPSLDSLSVQADDDPGGGGEGDDLEDDLEAALAAEMERQDEESAA